jgi:hypothetical protein
MARSEWIASAQSIPIAYSIGEADDALNTHWYPPGLPPRGRLGYYAERFSTVEVDSTYYRVPTESMVQGWADRTPAGFVTVPDVAYRRCSGAR